MFADALLDSHHQSRRGWATLTSFGVQAIAIAFLLIVPLFYTEVLPRISQTEIITMPLGPAPIIHAEPTPQPIGNTGSQNPVVGPAIQVPSEIPNHIDRSGDSGSSNPPLPLGGGGFYTGINSGDRGTGVIGSYGNGRIPVLEQAPIKHPLHVSVMMEGSLNHRVEPSYPVIAKSAGIQDTVILAAVIGTDGSVQKLQIVSGHPFLVQAAMNAVNQWHYRPYVLNGVPIEVDTQITVKFTLGR